MSYDLDALAALDKAATPGEWDWCDSTTMKAGIFATVFMVDLPEFIDQADAELIAAMRNALPAMLRDLRKFKEIQERWLEEGADCRCGHLDVAAILDRKE